METPRHTLYCFVEGGDLHEVAPMIESRFRQLASQAGWNWRTPEIVNRRQPRTPDMRPDDLLQWELGLTLGLPNPGQEPKDWFADVERVARFAGSVFAETGRELVLGIWDAERNISEDLFDIDSDRVDLGELRAVIGVRAAS
jgi:hypothetical protein